VQVRSFPVYHGGTYISLGFCFGADFNEFVYISDVKLFPVGYCAGSRVRRFMFHHAHDMSSQQEESWQFLVSMPRIKCLVLDCLNISGINSHLGLHEVNTVFTEWGFIV
jgi:hypothetical protein